MHPEHHHPGEAARETSGGGQDLLPYRHTANTNESVNTAVRRPQRDMMRRSSKAWENNGNVIKDDKAM